MAKAQLRQYVFTPGAAGAGTIEVPGKYDLQQFLVITNTTTNTILYNFADSTFAGTTISFTRSIDANYPYVLDNADGTTLITLAINTTGMAGTNTLQILYEQPFQYVRSPEIGTDAFERQRVSAPQSLLDADFEYGLQPTKWLTISLSRGYPSIYEIPGTDQPVSLAVTDASTQEGVLASAGSLITLTTTYPHGFTVGQPFTVKGFNSAVTGYERAEGSFIVYTVPTTTSLQFIAKGKVGFNNNDNLFTPFIQLRTGGFYTGSQINAVINATATASSSSGNLLTLTTTSGMFVGSPIYANIINTNAVATNTNNNYVTLGTTVGMTSGMPLYFSGVAFGGLTSGTTYWVNSIVDTRTVTLATNASLITPFVPTSTVGGGNMIVTAGASFGGVTSGSQYYISSIPTPGTPGTVTLSNNIIYTTTITATYAVNNSVRFNSYTSISGVVVPGTTNMVLGEQVVITGTTIGNLVAGTYYIYQIIDGYTAILSTSPTGYQQSGNFYAQISATGSMTAVVGATLTLTTVTAGNGYLWVTNQSQPSFTYSTPATTCQFTASLSNGSPAAGNQLIVTAIASGSLAIGQGIVTSSGTQTASLTVITGFVSGTLGGIGTYTVSTSNVYIPSSAFFYAVTNPATVTINFTSPHGFVPGQTINTYITSDNGTNNHLAVQGPFFVETTPNNYSLTYTARVSCVISGPPIIGTVYARSDCNYSHRPFDGGVQIGTGLPSYGIQAIRMSKKYIRYQSGKSINFNTGLLVAPNYFVRQIFSSGTAVGSTITITTDDVDHGCQVGATVTLSGVLTAGYNGTYTVQSIVDERTLNVLATQTLAAASPLTGATVQDPCLLSINNWYGSTVRSGTYDEQNGVFWQYDGQVMSVVRRSSTFQLAGTVTVVPGSGQIIGLNTKFTSQLSVGSRCVIRGMTHMVTSVVSDTLMYVNPQYRGSSYYSGIKITRTVDRSVPQSQWNMDRCDGSNGPYNPSGYQINPIKMQMVGLQWTWYGAGFIDWMLRGPEGKFITVHRLRNNNLNNEAWMRSGNLPVRFEVTVEGPYSYIVGTTGMSAVDTVVTIADASRFPTPNALSNTTVYIDNELITYTNVVSGYISATAVSQTIGGTGYNNTVTVSSTTNMVINQPIVFSNLTTALSLGNILSGTTYYIYAILSSTVIQLSTVSNGSLMTQTNATVATALMTYGSLIGCVRSQSLTSYMAGSIRTFAASTAATHSVTTGVILVGATAAPIVSHWGAAFIEDGGFDSDRSYIFNYQVPNIQLTTKKTTAFAVRLAPSVSNALSGDLGAREIINRASFLLQSLESCAGQSSGNAALVIEGILNPSNMPALSNITFSSLNSLVNQTGQPSFSQVAPGSSMVFTNSVNNYLTVPVFVPANSYYVPLTASPTSVTPNVLVGDDVFFPTTTGGLYGLTKISQTLSFTPAFTAGAVSAGTTATFTSANIASPLTLSGTVTSGTAAVGMVLTGSNVVAGTYLVALVSGNPSGFSTWTVSISQTVASTTITATPYTLTVTATSNPNNPILPGALLSGGAITANTYVSMQLTQQNGTYQSGYAGTYALVNTSGAITGTPTGATYNGVYLNQTTLTNIYGTGSLSYTANLSRGTYALPGETVFSYLNSPANKDSLDLSLLKELTNTPIGGRGTYPNGTDILFINTYITQGSPISQNMVLRWGEAQA
jgi:hypothetical protein